MEEGKGRKTDYRKTNYRKREREREVINNIQRERDESEI